MTASFGRIVEQMVASDSAKALELKEAQGTRIIGFIKFVDPIVREEMTKFINSLHIASSSINADWDGKGYRWFCGSTKAKSPISVAVLIDRFAYIDHNRVIKTPALIINVVNLAHSKERDRMIREVVRRTNYPVFTSEIQPTRILSNKELPIYPDTPFWKKQPVLRLKLGRILHLQGHPWFRTPDGVDVPDPDFTVMVTKTKKT